MKGELIIKSLENEEACVGEPQGETWSKKIFSILGGLLIFEIRMDQDRYVNVEDKTKRPTGIRRFWVLLFGQHPTFAMVINLALASYSACQLACREAFFSLTKGLQ